MRNPDRIDLIMATLTEVWKLHPDWRLCQLLSNISMRVDSSFYRDLFYLEDEDLLCELEILKET